MFSNILFLIFVLLLANLVPVDLQSSAWIWDPQQAFFLSILLYAAVIGIIFLQNRLFSYFARRKKGRMLFIVNCELILFLICYQFILGASRIFAGQPFETIPLLFVMGLYFGGLAVYHYSAPGKNHSLSELLLLLPFAIPFTALVLIFDLLALYPDEKFQHFIAHGANTWTGTLILGGISLFFIALLMIFMPFLIQKIWNCKPLKDPILNERLENICRQAHFKHAGLKTWSVLDHSLTAAIIGIIPKCRYILFTKRLLKEMPPESVEAILAHEIGHNYHKHLLIYPLILFGMSITLSLLSFAFLPAFDTLIKWAANHFQSPIWPIAYAIAIFSFYAGIAALYFRYVFGYFSRLFERQADLHVFTLGIPPQHLINALDHVGVATGNTHLIPNWHHWGIQQRIDLLKKAISQPKIVKTHDRTVKLSLIAYFIMLLCATIALFLI